MTLRIIDRLLPALVAACALICVGGCETVLNALNELEGGGSKKAHVDPEVLATYFDGPKIRPGVALAISVTAVGQPNRDAKQYFVDAEGCITMELVGTIKCDGLSLVELQQKVVTAYKEYYIDPSVTATFIYQPGQNMVSPWGTVKVLGEVHRPHRAARAPARGRLHVDRRQAPRAGDALRQGRPADEEPGGSH